MNKANFAARKAAALVAMAVAVPVCANADSTTPTYVGMTEQDVGVLDRARPAYDAKGIPLGGFRLFPALDAGASYDDNIFRTIAPTSDWFFTVSPSARLKSQWGRHFFEVYGGLNYYNYTEHKDENLTDWQFGSDGRIDISRAANLAANVSYGQYHELWSAPNNVGFQAEPNRYYQTHADAVTIYQPNRLGFSAGASLDNYDWSDTPRIGGGFLSNADRNQTEYQFFGKVYYDFSPGYAGYLKASYDKREYDVMLDRAGYDRSSSGYRLDGGLNFQISHLLRGEVFAGYLKQTFAKNGILTLQGVSGFDFGAQVDWYATPVMTFHVSAARRLDDVVLSGVSMADNKVFSVSADYELLPNVILQGRGSFTSSKYVGSTRTDDYPSAGIGVKYFMNRYVSADVNYTYSERSTNSSSFSYTDNVVSIGLTLHL